MQQSSAFSINPETHLGYVSLKVAHMARSLGFYQHTFGLQPLRPQENRVALSVDGILPIVLLDEQPDARPRPLPSTGLYHFAIRLPSRLELARTLRHLLEVSYPLQGASDHGVSEALYLEDPDGNGIEIYRDRPREEWPWRGGELAMVTEPLDGEGLMDALQVADRRWEGLPLGTTIGHIHLQVANLQQAEAFYSGALGFEVMQRFPPGHGAGSQPSALFLSAGGYHHHFGLNIWGSAGAPPPPPDAAGLDHFTIVLPGQAELDRVKTHLQTSGITLEDRGGGLGLQDPFGHAIVLQTEQGWVNDG
jgi:catechol 2,3-dioxygenase